MWQPEFAIPVKGNFVNSSRHFAFKSIAQPAGMLVAGVLLLLSQFCRSSESDDVGHGFCAGPPFTFLVTANLLRHQTYASPDVKCACAFWRIDFVAGQRKQI